MKIQPVGEFEWRIGETILQYIHVINDEALQQLLVQLKSCSYLYLIVRPNHEQLLRSAIRAANPRVPCDVIGLDSFLDLRTAFTKLDLGWSHERVIRKLVDEFNASVTASLADESILIAFPG
jgi:hypothetical protein